MSDVKPFSPDDARAAKKTVLPKELLQAVNELLAERYVDHGAIHITLTELKLRCRKLVGYDEYASIEDPTKSWPKGVWDFEPVYRDAGWKVNYDSPGYNESYEGFYIFERKKD